MAGRKVFSEEMKIKERYSALSGKFFKVLQEFLDSDDKADRKWAAEQLNKGFIRMIPQVVEGGDPDKPIPILYVSKNPSNRQDNEIVEEDKDSAGRDVSVKDGVDSPILDSSGTVGY